MPFTNQDHAFGRNKPQTRNLLVPVAALRQLADRDDIIAAIRRTLRFAIGELEWCIVPDLDAVKADLKRWQTIVEVNLALPGLDLEFTPQAMSLQIYHKATGALRDLLRDVLQPDPATGEAAKPSQDLRVREFFENIVAAHEAVAMSHIAEVESIFKKPNPSAESALRPLLDLLVDSITLHDAGVLVKNPTVDGKLGELYVIPNGDEIRVYRRPDLGTPQPPHIAYDWSDSGKIKAVFNNVELVYMMANPQGDGYGKSPLLSIIEKMVGSIYANAFMVDDFANNNRPYFVFDLGENVNQFEKDAVEKQWEEKVQRGRHRGIFIANKAGVKGFMPMPNKDDDTDSTLDKLKYWAGIKCAQYGLSLNDIGFTEDLHRTTAETQQKMTQARGVMSFAKVIAQYLNGEVVQGEMWLRDDPEDPNCMTGRVVPCFPFKDVKFQFVDQDDDAELERAEKMSEFVDRGIVNRNEVRHVLKLAPIKGGDVYTAVLGGSAMRVEELGNLPGPPSPEEQQQAEAQQRNPALMNGDGDQAPPQALQPGRPGQSQGGTPLALPKPQDQQKSVDSVVRLADELRKMAGDGGAV